MTTNNLVTKTYLKKELTGLEHRLETNLDKKIANTLRRLEGRIIKKMNILGLPKMANQN